jgi:23S rRNA (uridine2552-2'-O)-methyltransferase
MYAAERVGKNGRVVAVDVQEMAPLGDNVIVARGDILDPSGDASNLIAENAPYAVVLNDMAPSTSGSKASDQARSFELFMSALGIARKVGKPGSAYVGKIFMSGDFPLAKKAVTESYETCRILKPEGTRKNSTEIYIVGLGLRAM